MHATFFYEYDKNNIVVKAITDDGIQKVPVNLAGVTERRITHITPRKQMPVGLPEKVEESYLDLKTGSEVTLCSVMSYYTKEGRLFQEDHHDSKGKFRYSLKWDYDDHGNVIKETNSLGQTIVRRFDANENLIYEQGLFLIVMSNMNTTSAIASSRQMNITKRNTLPRLTVMITWVTARPSLIPMAMRLILTMTNSSA